MSSMPVVFVVFIFVWLFVISIFVVRMIHHYNTLTKGITKPDLKKALDKLLQEREALVSQVDTHEKLLQELKYSGMRHIQRVGILRFNPFEDTGGSQSFILALLDDTNSGIVITSLYARTGNRWYVKQVKSGEGKDLELSKEELKAIKDAKKIS